MTIRISCRDIVNTFALVGLACVLYALATVIFDDEDRVGSLGIDPEEQTFIVMLNEHRRQNNLPPVLIDPQLQAGAEWKSDDMASNNYFAHTDSLGRTPFTMLCEQAGYCYNAWKGENVAAGYVSAGAVFEGWHESPGHDANMLGEHYRFIGIARAYDAASTFGYYWTNEFGSEGIVAGTPTAIPPTAAPTLAPPIYQPPTVETATPTVTPTRTKRPTRTPRAPTARPTPRPTRTAHE